MNMDWMECVRWCHAAEDETAVDTYIATLVDLCQRSKVSSPILTRMHEEAGVRVAGYVVLYPGALGSVGSFRMDPPDDELKRDLLIDLAKRLFRDAFLAGAELVQGISPLIVSRVSHDPATAFVSPDPQRDLLLQSAGMIPIAKLVQMECVGIDTIPRLAIMNTGVDTNEIDFIAYDSIPRSEWSQLVERTYDGTKDVPELNGLRNIDSTLAGYASAIIGVPNTWWVVRNRYVPVGCLLITPTVAKCWELTYLGLLPEWRGRGLSKVVMNFVRDLALRSEIEGITLAVDLRNIAAIGLYQSCGFMTQRFVQAWMCFPE